MVSRGSTEFIPPHKALSEFPERLGNRFGRDLQLSSDELSVLGSGDFLLRDYLSVSDELPVNLFIAYFPSQRSGDTIHSPKNCIPGQGWAPTESGYTSVVDPGGSTITLNRYLVSKGNEQAVVYYWYQAHGRVTPSEYAAKIYLVSDAIRMNRTDGALVRVISPIGNADGVKGADKRALEVVSLLLPQLEAYIPR
jgi:EpsI family protein